MAVDAEGRDWNEIQRWFVEESGSLTYRQVADVAEELTCFNHKPCSYEKIREKGKEGLWLQKRAEFQAQRHRGILGDFERSYEIVTRTLHDRHDELSAAEIASLGNLQIKYGQEIMAINPPAVQEDTEALTRDDVVRFAEDIVDEIRAAHGANVVEMMLPVTPGQAQVEDPSPGSDDAGPVADERDH